MKILPVLAVAVLFTGLGFIIGRTSVKEENSGEITKDGQKKKEYRSTRRSGVDANDARRIGKIGGLPPVGYKNRVAHIKALAKNVGGNQGVPDFDALFGIWETARDMDVSEIQLALQDLENGALNVHEDMFIKAMLVMQLGKKDGPEAIAYTMNQNRSRMMPMMSMALQAWSSTDPEEAYTWYENNQDELNPRESTKFLAGAIAGLAEKDFSGALEKAKNVDNLSRTGVLSRLGSAIADQPEHRKQFTDYLLTLENDDVKNSAASSLAGQLVHTDIESAIQYVESWEGDDKDNLIDSVVREWSQYEQKKALDWHLSQTDDLKSVSRTFGRWASEDAKSARQWIENQPDNPDKDDLLDNASQRTVSFNSDYSGAVEWVSSITNETKRTERYTDLYQQWSHVDKEGAEEWASGLDEETRKAVIPEQANP